MKKTPSKKDVFLLVFIYAILFATFVFPSLKVPLEGVDCIAGCRTGFKGLPFAYKEYYASGVVGGSGSSFEGVIFIIDVLFWLIVTFPLKEVILFGIRKISKKSS